MKPLEVLRWHGRDFPSESTGTFVRGGHGWAHLRDRLGPLEGQEFFFFCFFLFFGGGWFFEDIVYIMFVYIFYLLIFIYFLILEFCSFCFSFFFGDSFLHFLLKKLVAWFFFLSTHAWLEEKQNDIFFCVLSPILSVFLGLSFFSLS